MSLNKVRLGKLVQKQTQFKLRSYSGIFSSLIVLQVLGILFSLNGVGMTGTSAYNKSVSITYYSADIVVVLTLIWAFISAILITTKAYREDDYIFVTNRLSSNLSNIIFMAIASIIGGVTAILSGFLLKLVVYTFFTAEFMHTGTSMLLSEVIGGAIIVILYVFLACAAGYLIGSIAQMNRMFIILVPVIVIGTTLLLEMSSSKLTTYMIEFYIYEHSFLMSLLKGFFTAVLLFTLATLLSNRKEVRA
ncbi:hypothetical protein QNH47_14370 [Virgibacillus halodenitrificans]|uniref:hypothetical protein n=1 Tax=Virgibacillus halodenitrificans TaxID=1482 RepID=UPI0024BF353C|nr:hypothetical protein [Virgibacillus halodenitrificans]WHX25334.1 hypothetical protein QNH47_14370 [Virgibacillus halodenitrificans]